MRGAEPSDDPSVLGWDEFLAKGDEVDDGAFAARLDALKPETLATLIYTSGTTGPPKGVMLTHNNLTWTADQGIPAFGVTGDDTSVSYLPLSHIAEQMFSLHIPITLGASVYFAESIDMLSDHLKDVRPSIFFAVPRVWEKFQTGIAAELAHASGIKARIAEWAQGAIRAGVQVRNAGRKPSGLAAIQAALADRLVGAKVRKAVGLDEARVLASGAAPVSAETLLFLAGFGMSVMEVYGQSEGSGPTTFNQPGRTKLGTVGPPFPGVDVEIADDSEILARGGNVFAGYYKNQEATDEALVDGWLYSGDLGTFDDEGYLLITGRKKDIIVTAGGKNIAPKNFEGGLKDHQLVSEAVLIGDRRKYLTALVTLDPEIAAEFAGEHDLSAPLYKSPKIIEEIQRAVDEVNEQHARVAQVKKFAILPRELSIAEGELTGTLKVKRDVVARHFADEIEALYE
jgi:long-chain acyl-CoA synthetase